MADLNPRVIVTDMDETLLNITPKWITLIFENINSYADLIEIPSQDKIDLMLEYPEIILLRDSYPLAKFFVLKENLPMTKEEAEKELNNRFLKLLDDEDFYMDIPLNPIAESLLLSLDIKDKVDKLIILTHSSNEATDKAKKKFIEERFSHAKVELVSLRLDQKKSDYLNSIQFGTFIDDSFTVIKDVIENDTEIGHEIIVPVFTYNANLLNAEREYISNLVSSKGINLSMAARSLPVESVNNLVKYQEEMKETTSN